MKRPSILLATLVGALALAGYANAGNPFNVTVVRFQPGTSPAQMRAAVNSAGADVVADLSEVNALAVVPRSPGFLARVDKNAAVTVAFQDVMLASNHGRGEGHGYGSGRAHDFDDNGHGSFPDPWHDLPSFLGVTNPEGILQWDDNRMNVPSAWKKTKGDSKIVVAVVDTGVDAKHRELKDQLDNRLGGNFVSCDDLHAMVDLGLIDPWSLIDCNNSDFEGHGTWVASRIAGDANGFASNGVAPGVRVASYKVLAAGLGGLTSWIVSGIVDACSSRDVDVVNLSFGGYLDPSDPDDADVYELLSDVVSYCKANGVALFAAAGNEHVRIDRVNMMIDGEPLAGVGRVTNGPDGIATVTPGSPSPADYDLRGLLEVPAGLPGVTMVSATANAIGAAPSSVPLRWRSHIGSRDQLAYYSNYGSRVDLAAPGGARRYEIPLYDGGDGDILYGGWGSFGALVPKGLICSDPFEGDLVNSACFKLAGQGFGWMQGTSMAAPNVSGVAALVLSERRDLRNHPDALVARLKATAQRHLTNYMGGNDPDDFSPALDGTPCPTGFCHIDQHKPIPFSDAYGAGLVDAGAAVR